MIKPASDELPYRMTAKFDTETRVTTGTLSTRSLKGRDSAGSVRDLNYYFYSLYGLATSHDTSNYQNHEHNAYARFLEELQLEDCQ